MRVPRARCTSPVEGGCRPAMIRNSEVLPMPFGPTNPTRAPWGSPKLISEKMSRAPKERPRPDALRMDMIDSCMYTCGENAKRPWDLYCPTAFALLAGYVNASWAQYSRRQQAAARGHHCHGRVFSLLHIALRYHTGTSAAIRAQSGA